MCETNVLGAMNVIDASIDQNVKKVIALSTDRLQVLLICMEQQNYLTNYSLPPMPMQENMVLDLQL